MKSGYGIFGKSYEVMLKNDLHDKNSIDHCFLNEMILLDSDSYKHLYHNEPVVEDMTHHEIYRFSKMFKKSNDKDTILEVLSFTEKIASNYDVPFEEMLFGGTEKQIIERGTNWCADMARVCCVLLKCLNIPCRIVRLVNVDKAYHGHVVCEAYYEGRYGVIDPIFGYQFYDKGPLNAYDLLNYHHLISIGYEGYMDLYKSISINEYNPCDTNNDYSISKANEYYKELMRNSHNDKWIMGEESRIINCER